MLVLETDLYGFHSGVRAPLGPHNKNTISLKILKHLKGENVNELGHFVLCCIGYRFHNAQ